MLFNASVTARLRRFPCRSILRQLQVSQPQNATYHIIARIFRKITSPKQSSNNEGVTSGRARHRAGRGMIVGTGLTILLLPALYSRWFRLVAVPQPKQKRSCALKRKARMLEMTESTV